MVTEKRKMQVALNLGALAGLIFACTSWGIDLIIQAGAHVIVPWVKFVPGLVFAVISGALCSLLAAKSGKLGVIMVIWLGWGALVIWIAGLIPVFLQEPFLLLFHPKLNGVVNFPPINLEVRFFLTWLVMFGLMLIAGFLYQNVLETAVVNQRIFTTSMFVGVWLLFFAIIGSSVDGVYNLPLRRAALLTHEAIQTTISHVAELDKGQAALKLGILSMRPMKEVINNPYWMVVKSYDETLEQVQVMVDFSGYWFTCEVSPTTIYVCKPS